MAKEPAHLPITYIKMDLISRWLDDNTSSRLAPDNAWETYEGLQESSDVDSEINAFYCAFIEDIDPFVDDLKKEGNIDIGENVEVVWKPNDPDWMDNAKFDPEVFEPEEVVLGSTVLHDPREVQW